MVYLPKREIHITQEKCSLISPYILGIQNHGVNRSRDLRKDNAIFITVLYVPYIPILQI